MRPQTRLLLCLLVIALFPAVGVAATASPDAGSHPAPSEANAKQVDAIFEAWNMPSTPGASVAVIEQGRVVFEKGYGIANLEYGVPIKPDTVFHVASVSKQFTAMAVVLLELDEKLSLEDDIHKYLPELPDYGSRITIRNLLQHTSGGAVLTADNSVDAPTLARRKFRDRELASLSFSVLRRNSLLLAVAGVSLALYYLRPDIQEFTELPMPWDG